jgi:molybdopterin molybdotransferase
MTSADPVRHGDVRMRGFAQRSRVTDVWQWLQARVQPLPPETIPVTAAAGRVLAEGVTSDIDVPGFARAMMDGYALHSGDTSGASPYNPVPLIVLDESLPGRPARQSITPGQAIRIMTGAPLPSGADAVLPVEHVREQSTSILALHEVSPGKHVARPGEDIAAGTLVLPGGRRLRPQDVGVLASIGIGMVPVVQMPRVRIVVTGNELLPPGSRPHGARIVDSNGPMLAALVERDGGLVRNPGIVPDDPRQIRAAMADDADVIVVSGGSSVGQEDHAPCVVAEDGELVFHGIAMRPSSPTGVGCLGTRLVFLLPGNPVSCLCAYDFFAGRAIRLLGGRTWEWPYRSCRRRLRRKLVSTVGRVDYARVKLVEEEIEPLAISGAAILSSTTRADGFVVVPEDSEGYAEGTEVELFLYDP